uniref:Peptidase S1 domain-containing protein n=1 Tax=Arion vulgaris TaxID=1028688 RepID=A0A0B6XZD4_9EUPU
MSHTIFGLVLTVFLTSGLVQANDIYPGRRKLTNTCLSLRGTCQLRCAGQSEVELGKLNTICGSELRCCRSHLSSRFVDSQHNGQTGAPSSSHRPSSSIPLISATSNKLSPTVLPQRSSNSQLPLKFARNTPSLSYPVPVLSFDMQKADIKTDPSFVYLNINSKSKECGVPVLGRVRRIVGGTQAERCLLPWMVYISRDPGKDDLCGGTLVSDRHVITAAHCYDYLGTNWPALYIGEYNKNEGGSKSKFVTSSYKVSVHPDYNRFTFSYDIAILTLNIPIPLENYQCMRPICLPDESHVLKVGDTCTVAGWGSTSRATDKPAVSSPSLMKTQIKVLNDNFCKNKFGNLFNSRSQLCAGDLTGSTDSCVVSRLTVCW